MRRHLRPFSGHLTAWRALAAALLLGGCTTVVVHSEGRVTTENRFGILRLDFAGARATAVAVSGVGIVALPDAVSIGWTRWQGVRMAPGSEDSCIAVSFSQAHEE